VLAKLEDEIDRASDRDRLPYVDATIKEALRLHPVIPAVGRRVKKTMRVAGYEVEEGTLLVPGVWLTHRQPDLYPNPESFEPERWLDKKPDPYAFLPFGGGIRRCIGMAFALFEMRVVLSTILARLELRPARPKPAKTSLRGFTHAPRGGVPVVVVRARAEPRPAVPAERRDGVSP
jgi:cytochrome P450